MNEYLNQSSMPECVLNTLNAVRRHQLSSRSVYVQWKQAKKKFEERLQSNRTGVEEDGKKGKPPQRGMLCRQDMRV